MKDILEAACSSRKYEVGSMSGDLASCESRDGFSGVHAQLLQSCLTLQPTRPLCPWDSLGNNTGVGCHALPQGIFPTQGLNLRLYGRQILYPAGKPSLSGKIREMILALCISLGCYEN